MKKALVIIIVLGIVIFFTYVTYFQKTVITKSLSHRAKEYIKEKKNLSLHSLQQVIVTISAKEPKTIQTKCYEIIVPFDFDWKELPEECTIQIYKNKPKIQLVIIQKHMQTGKLEDDSSIQMRRSQPELYEEQIRQINKKTFLIFAKNDFQYERTAFIKLNQDQISITLLSPSNRNLDNYFEALLSSFKYFL